MKLAKHSLVSLLSKMTEVKILLSCIWDVPSLHMCWGTDCPEEH